MEPNNCNHTITKCSHLGPVSSVIFLSVKSEMSERVRLNVGGVRFETTLTTIRRIPDSMLAVMFSGQHTVNKDEDGFVFIDRSPTHFDDILNFLRTGKVSIGTPHQGLEAELEYYGLHGAFLDAGGQEVLDPEYLLDTPLYLLLSIEASKNVTAEENESVLVSITMDGAIILTKLQQMLSPNPFGLRWVLSGTTLVGAYDPAYDWDVGHLSQARVNELMRNLLSLISNGDFGSEFHFELIHSSSTGTVSGPGGSFINQSVFRRLLPWYKHVQIPQAQVPRKRKVDELAARSGSHTPPE
jgi:hypothetical protein